MGTVAAQTNCDDFGSTEQLSGFTGNDLCDVVKDNTGIGVGVLVALIVIILVLPMAYLYWWIVVNSLRKRIVEMKRQILPVQQPMVFATQQVPAYGGYQDPSAASGYENKYWTNVLLFESIKVLRFPILTIREFLNQWFCYLTGTRCLQITEKVSFNIASEASYVYILSGQKLIKNAENGPFWRVFENLKLSVKQCYQTGQF